MNTTLRHRVFTIYQQENFQLSLDRRVSEQIFTIIKAKLRFFAKKRPFLAAKKRNLLMLKQLA